MEELLQRYEKSLTDLEETLKKSDKLCRATRHELDKPAPENFTPWVRKRRHSKEILQVPNKTKPNKTKPTQPLPDWTPPLPTPPPPEHTATTQIQPPANNPM